MSAEAVEKISEGAYFIVDRFGYTNLITPFDLGLATQTISSLPLSSPHAVEAPEPHPSPEE